MLLQPTIMWTVLILAFTSAQARLGPRGPAYEEWRTFVIPEFGTRVEYPAAIFAVQEGKAEKGTGERLITEDGRATLSIYSRPNDSGETPRTYLLRNLRFPQAALEYQRVTGSFFAISAVAEGTIYYSRCNPQREKRAWDAIVTRISRSLRPLQG